MNRETRDYLHLHFIVFVWGFTAILGKLITLGPVELVFYRTLLAGLGLVFLAKITKRPYWIKDIKDLKNVLVVGVLIAAHWILFFLAARVSNVSVCLAGMATTSIWTGLLEPIMTGKRIRGYEILISFLGFMGMVWIFRSELDHMWGFTIAIFSAFLAAVFSIINAGVTKRQDPYTMTMLEMFVATIVIFLFLPFYDWMVDTPITYLPRANEWIYLLMLAFVCTVYAFSASVELTRRLSAFSVNLSINLEPIYGIILAILIFGDSEKMSSGFYLGGSLILVSVLIYPPINKMMRRKALEADLMR